VGTITQHTTRIATPYDAQPLRQPDRLQAALAGSLRPSASAGRLRRTLGVVSLLSIRRHYPTQLSALRPLRSSPSGDFPRLLPLFLAACFSLRMLFRYARVTMSRADHSSLFRRSQAPGSGGCVPSLLTFVRSLPLTTSAARRASSVTRSVPVVGPPWPTTAPNPRSVRCRERQLLLFAGARSWRSACALGACRVGHGLPACSATAATPNPAVEGTSEKLRFSVPRRLRRRAAPHLERSASETCPAEQ